METGLFLANEQASTWVAMQLAVCVTAPLVLTFSGSIGSGKTTIIRAMLQRLGIHSAIKSPTFSIVESYPFPWGQLHHFDLYRIHDETELDYIGFRDYFTPDAICCIEWPEQVRQGLEGVDMHLSLSMQGSGRQLTMQACSLKGRDVLSCFTQVTHE